METTKLPPLSIKRNGPRLDSRFRRPELIINEHIFECLPGIKKKLIARDPPAHSCAKMQSFLDNGFRACFANLSNRALTGEKSPEILVI